MREDNLKRFFELTGELLKDVPEKEIDVTGIELTPGDPDVCLGNEKHGLECCCDECNYYLLCFPEYLNGLDNLADDILLDEDD